MAAVVSAYLRAAIFDVVDPTVIYVVAPGFYGGMNMVDDRVLQTAGETVRYRRTAALLPRLD